MDFVRQIILPDTQTPRHCRGGCVGLEARPEWQGMSVAVFNGDNLPPQGPWKKLISATAATVALPTVPWGCLRSVSRRLRSSKAVQTRGVGAQESLRGGH